MDEIYIKKVCEGHTDSFRYFMEHYKDMAFSLALSIVKDEFTAEEVVQDAFIKAFHALRSFNRSSKFSTWFYRIVVNESFMCLKRQKREIIQFKGDYDTDIIDENALSSLENDEQVYLINEALKKLPPNESLVLRLFYLEEESIKSVCEVTGWSQANTKVLLHRGRKNMLAILGRLMKTET